MIELSDVVEPVHPAATVVLVRDCPDGLEALLVQRSKAVRHLGGMWVFPGGKVDDDDYPQDRDEYGAALNAAIRETREEAGLEISADQLVYLSHWTTPEGAKNRFATWFFLAVLEDEQEVTVDGGEIAHHRWVRPEVALAELADLENPFRLMPPAFISLVDIAPYRTCLEVKNSMHARDAIVYAPRMTFVQDGVCFLYAGDAGYEQETLEAEGPRHRMYMINDQLEYIREL